MKPNSSGGPGYQELWGWFGLSYASWLTLPRVLMHAMPDEWQAQMAELLKEYDRALVNRPRLGTSVRATDELSGKMVPMPQWLIRYRHPDMDELRHAFGDDETDPEHERIDHA